MLSVLELPRPTTTLTEYFVCDGSSISTSPPEIALTKGWKSHYWKNWVDGLDLYDDSDVGCEVAVADDDGDDIADDRFISDVIEGYIDEDPAVEDARLPMLTHESGTGLPPPADDDRHVRPALYHHEQQGGLTKSKLHCRSVHFEGESCSEGSTARDEGPPDRWRCDRHCASGHISEFSDDMVFNARRNFARFRSLDINDVGEQDIEKTSLGVRGWAVAGVLDNDAIDKEVTERSQPSDPVNPWSYGSTDRDCDSDVHNTYVVRLIAALGENDSGRRAVLRAIAERQGISADSDLDMLADGMAPSDMLLRVPAHLRGPLQDIGLESALAPISLFEVIEKEGILLAGDTWSDLEFEVALDSGAVIHVCAPNDCPGYALAESPGSRRGQEFLMGDGGTIPNLGQKSLNLLDESVGRDLSSVFQIAAVTRPLMSVGKICDEGHEVIFRADMAVVNDSSGSEICRFTRSHGGLYLAKMKLRAPTGFSRPE